MPFRAVIAITSAGLLAGCTIPDVSGELTTMDKAVADTARDYRAALQIDAGSGQRSLINAAVANRSVVMDLTDGCQARAARVQGIAQNCDIDAGGLPDLTLSLGRADQQWRMISGYVQALTELASARSDAEVSKASGKLTGALSRMSQTVSGGSVSPLLVKLADNKAGVDKAISLAVRQYQFRELRKAINKGHAPLARILLNLRDVAKANGAQSRQQAFLKLQDAADHADELRQTGSDAQYRAALRDLYQARDAFHAYERTGLIPRLERLVRVHGALRDRVNQRATPQEIAALLEDLRDLEQSF